MTLRVFDENRGRVETHWLVVEDRAGEGSQVLHFEVSRRIRNQRERRRMRLGKAIQCKRAYVLNDVVLSGCVDPIGRHASAELAFQALHAFPRTSHADGAPQFVRFRAGEVGYSHSHAEQLFLEERHAESTFQHWFKRSWLPDPKEQWSGPACPCDLPGDLGQTGVGLASVLITAAVAMTSCVSPRHTRRSLVPV
jgi:hypothetical protein